MTVFIAHHEADRTAAEALEKYLERRGHFVELEDAERGVGEVQRRDLVAVLWSKAAASMEQRALTALASDCLVLVRLDRSAPPEALRAAPSIDAAAKTRHEAAWAAVAKAAQDMQARPLEYSSAAESPPARAKPKARRAARLMLAMLALAVAAGGAFAWLRRDLLLEFRPDEAIARALKAL